MAVTATFAAVTFDPATGTGFVGKGDVQLVFGWNNKALQDNANSVQFSASSTTEVTWECTNSNNDKVQERSRITTTEGLVSSIARERNQITGFILSGYNGTSTSSTDGPALNSCPSGPWSLTSPAGDPVPVGGGLEVSIDGTNWFALN
jgi:hypothetical protein